MTIAVESSNKSNLSDTVVAVVNRYLHTIEHDKIGNIYDIVIEEVELALFQTVIERCRFNQVKASKILGLSRVTLRTKLIKYFEDKYCGRREIRTSEEQ